MKNSRKSRATPCKNKESRITMRPISLFYHIHLVGAAGFELATPCTPCKFQYLLASFNTHNIS